MVNYPDYNLLAIIVGIILNNVIGFLWYYEKTPTGQFWLREMNYASAADVDMDSQKLGINTALSIPTTVGLAFFVAWSSVDSFFDGVLIGLYLWFAFLLATQYATVAFENRNQKLYLNYLAYQLIVFILLGGLFAIWN